MQFFGFADFLKNVLFAVTFVCILGFMLLREPQASDAKKSDFDFSHHPILFRIGVTSFAIAFLSLLTLVGVGFASHTWPDHAQGVFSVPRNLGAGTRYISQTEDQIYRFIEPLPYLGGIGFFISVLTIGWLANRRERKK